MLPSNAPPTNINDRRGRVAHPATALCSAQPIMSAIPWHVVFFFSALDDASLSAAVGQLSTAYCKVVVLATESALETLRVLREAQIRGLWAGYNWILSGSAELSEVYGPHYVGLLWAAPCCPAAVTPQTVDDARYALAMDALATYARALEALIRRRTSIFRGAALFEAIKSVRFGGHTGPVQFDAAADRLAPHALHNLVAPHTRRVVVREVRAPAARPNTRGTVVVLQTGRIVYAGNRTTFDNQVRHYLEWADPTQGDTTFNSTCLGDAIRPFPTVQVPGRPFVRVS